MPPTTTTSPVRRPSDRLSLDQAYKLAARALVTKSGAIATATRINKTALKKNWTMLLKPDDPRFTQYHLHAEKEKSLFAHRVGWHSVATYYDIDELKDAFCIEYSIDRDTFDTAIQQHIPQARHDAKAKKASDAADTEQRQAESDDEYSRQRNVIRVKNERDQQLSQPQPSTHTTRQSPSPAVASSTNHAAHRAASPVRLISVIDLDDDDDDTFSTPSRKRPRTNQHAHAARHTSSTSLTSHNNQSVASSNSLSQSNKRRRRLDFDVDAVDLTSD